MKRVLLCLLLAGCLQESGPMEGDGAPVAVPCAWDGAHTRYLGPEHSLNRDLPEAGSTPGNGFVEAFLSNDMDEWTLRIDQAVRVEGNISLEFWSRGNNMPAPIVISGGPTEGYHFFNQVGTDRGFLESYAIENDAILGDTEVRHITESFQTPEGGLIIEANDTFRLLLTNLVADDAQGDGPHILWGGQTPSAVHFEATCIEQPAWERIAETTANVDIPLHQGLLTGAVPATEGLNRASVPFSLDARTERLTIRIAQTDSLNPVKNDIDLTVIDANGTPVWSIGSPYTDEVGTLWADNLAAMMPAGDYTVQVNSYSGHDYAGLVTIEQEVAL